MRNPFNQSNYLRLGIAFIYSVFGLAACHTQANDEKISSGTLPLSEISGVAVVGNRLLLAADDPEGESDEQKLHMIILLDDAESFLKGKTPATKDHYRHLYGGILKKIPGLKANDITDLEDIATDGKGNFYLISSHSQSQKQRPDEETKPKRQRLLRISLDESSGEVQSASLSTASLFKSLPEELKSSIGPGRRPGAMTDGKYDPGFNIEGMAWAPEDALLIGLRSPLTQDGKAYILRLSNASDAFLPGAAKIDLSIAAQLALEGKGIRDMYYDPETKLYWLIAGNAPDPDDGRPKLPNDWAIWTWDGKQNLVRKYQKSDLPADITLDNPEALTLIGTHPESRSLLLISDDGSSDRMTPPPPDKAPRSSYILIPLSSLKK